MNETTDIIDGRGNGTVQSHDDLDARRAAAHRVAVTVWSLAALLLCVAILLNYLLTPGADKSLFGEQMTQKTEAVPGLDFTPEKSAVDLLPESVIAYETIARHEVPGKGKLAGEAIYVTLNMDTEIQRPVVSYARVEAFQTDIEAQRALEVTYADYPVKRGTMMIKGGTTVAQTGYRSEEGAWFVGWTKGPYAIWVKTSFKDLVPYTKRNFLQSIGTPVIEGIDKFQRTGKQGLSL